MARILLVDDEANILSVLTTLLEAEGHQVTAHREGSKARESLLSEEFELMVTDVCMTPVGGMELVKVAHEHKPDMAVLVFTAFGSVETAIEAMKLGAFDYITKPFKAEELLLTIQRALDYKHAISENRDLKAQLETRYRFENIVAESPSMKHVCQMIERVAPTDATVLIYGESGTGKELVAKAIHAYSRRKDANYLAVNCAALPEALLESEMFGHVKGAFTGASANKKGLFESVEGGTIFLDEIGAMPLSIQGKLLRVLQEKEIRRVGGNENISVNARVLAATNTRLEDLMKAQQFRKDLFYRLSTIPINIAPLRERQEDVMPLVYHVIREELGQDAESAVIDADVSRILEAYSWPGNVRELENAIKHALTFAADKKISKEVLPAQIVSGVGDITAAPGEDEAPEDFRFKSLKEFLRHKEKEYVKQVINAVGGDKERAAETLSISMASLYRKLPKEGQAPDTP